MKSKWLPPHDFSPSTWRTFWNSVPNNAGDSRKEEIFDRTKYLDWIYLGDGKPDIKKILSGITVDNYTFPIKYDQDLMRKTIQGNHRHTNKVQIWIAVKKPDDLVSLQMLEQKGTLLPSTQGFFKIIFDPFTQKHTLSQHNSRGSVAWHLDFDAYERAPIAINYK
jgi:hypothetical protein